MTLAIAYALAVIAAGRLTRLITHDAYPPMQALRLRWVEWQETRDYARTQDRTIERDPRHGWSTLLTCPFCAAPYVTALILAAGMLMGVWRPGWSWESVWWVGAVWASISYLAAILVAYDEPAE